MWWRPHWSFQAFSMKMKKKKITKYFRVNCLTALSLFILKYIFCIFSFPVPFFNNNFIFQGNRISLFLSLEKCIVNVKSSFTGAHKEIWNWVRAIFSRLTFQNVYLMHRQLPSLCGFENTFFFLFTNSLETNEKKDLTTRKSRHQMAPNGKKNENGEPKRKKKRNRQKRKRNCENRISSKLSFIESVHRYLVYLNAHTAHVR